MEQENNENHEMFKPFQNFDATVRIDASHYRDLVEASDNAASAELSAIMNRIFHAVLQKKEIIIMNPPGTRVEFEQLMYRSLIATGISEHLTFKPFHAWIACTSDEQDNWGQIIGMVDSQEYVYVKFQH